MKKINGIDTLSTHDQRAIMQWYGITKSLLCVVIMILIATTATLWCIQKYYAHPCNPCISPAYAAVIAKKYAAYTAAIHIQKQKNDESQKTTALIANYVALINLHITQPATIQLTDLHLSTQGVSAHYTVTNRAALQDCLNRMIQSSVVYEAAIESIEQKNKSTTINCVIKATWHQ